MSRSEWQYRFISLVHSRTKLLVALHSPLLKFPSPHFFIILAALPEPPKKPFLFTDIQVMGFEGEPVLHYSFLEEAASPSANGVSIPLQLYPSHCRWSPEGYDELITEITIGIMTPDVYAQAWYNVEHPNAIGTPTESQTYPLLVLSTSFLQVDPAELDDLQLSGITFGSVTSIQISLRISLTVNRFACGTQKAARAIAACRRITWAGMSRRVIYTPRDLPVHGAARSSPVPT
ncbi:hypothetical protein BKA93DRAFT_750684 [Sparassis latifolia]